MARAYIKPPDPVLPPPSTYVLEMDAFELAAVLEALATKILTSRHTPPGVSVSVYRELSQLRPSSGLCSQQP